MNDSAQTNEQAERRRSPRERALLHVVVSKNGVSEEASVTVGRTVDVSATGVRVQTPGHLCVDDTVRLEIAVDDQVVHARGRVVRSARTGDLVEAGIDLSEIGDADRRLLST